MIHPLLVEGVPPMWACTRCGAELPAPAAPSGQWYHVSPKAAEWKNRAESDSEKSKRKGKPKRWADMPNVCRPGIRAAA